MYKRAISAFLLTLGLAYAMVSLGDAQPRYAPYPYGSQVLPLEQVLPNVRKDRAGRFYDAEGPFPDGNGGYHYRIKWLTPEGRVIWLDTDARSGHVTGVARGDWRGQGGANYGGAPEHGFYGGPPARPYEGPGDGYGRPDYGGRPNYGGGGPNYGGPHNGPGRGGYGGGHWGGGSGEHWHGH